MWENKAGEKLFGKSFSLVPPLQKLFGNLLAELLAVLFYTNKQQCPYGAPAPKDRFENAREKLFGKKFLPRTPSSKTFWEFI
ncbi:MAG: hypothetical protein IJY66_07605, partial [Clostridia bacterium]|nr:hypothetical protein [Clostridia bacterium]